jgi:hypothetical protein
MQTFKVCMPTQQSPLTDYNPGNLLRNPRTAAMRTLHRSDQLGCWMSPMGRSRLPLNIADAKSRRRKQGDFRFQPTVSLLASISLPTREQLCPGSSRVFLKFFGLQGDRSHSEIHTG